MLRASSKASFLLRASWMRCLILARKSSKLPRSWGSSFRSLAQSCQISCLPGERSRAARKYGSFGGPYHWGCVVLGVAVLLPLGQRQLPTWAPKRGKLCPVPSWGTPGGAQPAAHSSHLSSTPSCSMKAAKCFFSSLSVPSHVGLARTKQLLRDAVFRRRCSLLTFWELRNCPAETQPSAPRSQRFPPQ